MKRLLGGVVFGLLLGCFGMMAHQGRAAAAAYPCNIATHFGAAPCHGYFSGKAGSTADFNNLLNVLPSPALTKVTGSTTFIATIKNDLASGNYQTRIGAAFIIDTMLNHATFSGSGGVNSGVAYARNNFVTWENLVNHFSTAPAGASYGIRWSVMPTYAEFCGTAAKPTMNSAFFSDIQDDAFHATICPYGYTFGTPIIEFYWAGGKFDIGKGCGNVEMTANTVPIDAVPKGTITLTCDGATSRQVARIEFSDADGATDGYITTGGWTSGTVGAPGPVDITIPQSATEPYVPQLVSLHVKDVGRAGTQRYSVIATADTNVPCAGLTCGSLDVTPTRLDPYMHFSVTVTVTNAVNQPPSPATMDIAVTPPGGASFRYNGSKAAGGSGSVSTATFNNLGPTNAAGVFAVHWILHPPSGAATACNGTFTVTYLPYLQVYGGDVMAGASPTTAGGTGMCATNADAGVFSWNNHTADFSGGGAQYAVQALAAIQDFASGQDSDAPSPAGLSFANTYTPADAGKLAAGQGLFGGYFGGTGADCDFTSDITSAPATANTTIGTTTIAAGTQTVRYITGADVYIDGNIVYAGTGGWTKVTDIPYFKLVVVGGNIYINSNVTQLDGLYVAEPDSSGGGTIYTCASALDTAVTPAAGGYFNTCKHQLVVNGAFVARQVQFLRTAGSLGQAKAGDTIAANHSAEVFNYTPELWLPRGAAAAGGGYAAITALPPVL